MPALPERLSAPLPLLARARLRQRGEGEGKRAAVPRTDLLHAAFIGGLGEDGAEPGSGGCDGRGARRRWRSDPGLWETHQKRLLPSPGARRVVRRQTPVALASSMEPPSPSRSFSPSEPRRARDHLRGAAACGPGARRVRAAQGVTGGPRLSRSGSGRAWAPGITARAFKPAASAVRGAVRACRRRPR